MNGLVFLLATLALPILGAGAAFHPSVRGEGLAARAAASFALGAVALTLSALALTAAGIAWSLPALAVFPVTFSIAAGAFWRRRPAPGRRAAPTSSRVAAAAYGVAALSLAVLAAALVTGSATSVDYLFFWGVKAARFAEARSLDPALLNWAFFSHAVPDYPPLVPVVQAWGALAAGRLPWRAAPLASWLWVAAAAPLLLAQLRRRLPPDGAAAVTGFWVAAASASMAFSLSGGNAEAPLLFFETLALAAILCEDDGTSRFLPSLMLAGAVLTKVEGSVAALLLLAGTAARDGLERRPRTARRTFALAAAPAAALLAWFLFQLHSGLRVGFRSHGGLFDLRFEHLGTILARLPLALEAGTFGLSWALPLVLLAAARPNAKRLAPALVLGAGLLAFLVFDYLHDAEDPRIRIAWTAPRVSQPALSALILAAGLASFDAGRRQRSRTSDAASVAPLTAAP